MLKYKWTGHFLSMQKCLKVTNRNGLKKKEWNVRKICKNKPKNQTLKFEREVDVKKLTYIQRSKTDVNKRFDNKRSQKGWKRTYVRTFKFECEIIVLKVTYI